MKTLNPPGFMVLETDGLDVSTHGRIVRNIESARSSLEVASLQILTGRVKTPHVHHEGEVVMPDPKAADDGMSNILSDLALISRRLEEIQIELELRRTPLTVTQGEKG